jgi:ribosome-binding factor A
MKGFRKERLQKELKQILNSVFQGDISDRRLSGIEITRVKITADLSTLRLFFTGIDEKILLDEIYELLIKSSGFIKKKIAGAGIMRTIPHIVRDYDNKNEKKERLNDLFKQIAEEKRNSNYYDDDSDNNYYEHDDDHLLDEDLEEYDDYSDELEEDLEFEYDEIDLDDEE